VSGAAAAQNFEPLPELVVEVLEFFLLGELETIQFAVESSPTLAVTVHE
jgi:hypothetical protein